MDKDHEDCFYDEDEFDFDDELLSYENLGLPTPQELGAARAKSDAMMYNLPVIKAALDLKKWLETEYPDDLDVKIDFNSYFNSIGVCFIAETFDIPNTMQEGFYKLVAKSDDLSVCKSNDDRINFSFGFNNAIRYLDKTSD